MSRNTIVSTNTVQNTQLSGGDLDVDGNVVYGDGNVGDVGQGAIFGSGNSVDNRNFTNNYSSDYGAIDRAADISGAALDLGYRAINRNTDVAIAGLDNARDQMQYGLDFASRVNRDSLDATGDYMDRAYDFSGEQIQAAFQGGFGIAGDALDFGRNALNELGQNNAEALAFAKAVYDGNSGLVDASLEGNAQLARQVSQSSQQSLNESVVKLAMIAAAAIAIVFIFKS